MKKHVHVLLIDFLKVLFNLKLHVLNVGKFQLKKKKNYILLNNILYNFRSVSTKNDLVRDISLQLPFSSSNGIA
jgi:hypothetical protein